MSKLRLGVIGLGSRGSSMARDIFARQDNVIVTALCDVYEDRNIRSQNDIERICQKKPFITKDYKELLARDDVDAVYISSSWETHIYIAVDAMKAGKVTGIEVGGAYSLQECFDLVAAYEESQTPFMFMENCCYDKEELLATNMARKGLFGKIVHCQGAYAHDLREEILRGKENRNYRLKDYIHRNCENYPTHDLGPIAKLLDINRGNRMVSLVSVSSKSIGLKEHLKNRPGQYDPALYDIDFKQGDIVLTIITCINGETILLKLDTTLPNLYSRDFTIRGTEGFYEQKTNTAYIEGMDVKDYAVPVESYRQVFNNAVQFEEEYLPDIWKKATQQDMAAGHGGMDAFLVKAFIEGALNKTEMPIDVYDAAAWMSISCLSEESILNAGKPVDIPDFTRGKWMTRPRKDVVEM